MHGPTGVLLFRTATTTSPALMLTVRFAQVLHSGNPSLGSKRHFWREGDRAQFAYLPNRVACALTIVSSPSPACDVVYRQGEGAGG